MWERVTFRIFGICRRDARSKVGDYVRLARDVNSQSLNYQQTMQRMERIGSGKYAIKNALGFLTNANCYEGWEEELRYFLFRYEEHLAEEQGIQLSDSGWEEVWSNSAAQSIEHILPQNRGVEEPEDGKVFVHRLGNLTLLPPTVNSQLGDMSPALKSQKYRDQALLVTKKVANLCMAEPGGNQPPAEVWDTWTEADITSRESELLEFAELTWG